MKNLKSELYKNYEKDKNYIRFGLTFTNRVIAGWAITIVGLIKLWQTEDPISWWPILMGGTGLMIFSRGMDSYIKNKHVESVQKEEDNLAISEGQNANPFQHASVETNTVVSPMNLAVAKHKEYQKRLPVKEMPL